MNVDILRKIGLTENEIKVYLDLLRSGSSSAYEISKRIDVYRVHVYDKLEQLMEKGLVTYVLKGAKKYFNAAHPSKINQYLEDKKKILEQQEHEVERLMPELEALTTLPREDTFVEVFKGKEGLKFFLKDIIKTKPKEVLVTGINDAAYQEVLPIFMQQYFRDLRKNKIRERVITIKQQKVFTFNKEMAATTTYRFLPTTQFNPTNTFVYDGKVILVTFGTPITAIRIKNTEIAKTYKSTFEHLWRVAKGK